MTSWIVGALAFGTLAVVFVQVFRKVRLSILSRDAIADLAEDANEAHKALIAARTQQALAEEAKKAEQARAEAIENADASDCDDLASGFNELSGGGSDA